MQALRSSSSAARASARPSSSSSRRSVVVIRAEQAGAPPAPAAAAPPAAAPKKKAPPPPWKEPVLDADTPSPIFGGSTGGLLRKAQVEEFYVTTWESPKEQIFEMPTGGAAIMRKGPNLLKFARKEQGLALTTQLRTKFKMTPCVYRVYADGKVEYLHPKDGVYPEKVNAGRVGENQNMRKIGDNVDPIKVKFTGSGPFEI